MKKKIIVGTALCLIYVHSYAGKVIDLEEHCPAAHHCKFERTYSQFENGNALAENLSNEDSYYLISSVNDQIVKFTPEKQYDVVKSHHALSIYNSDEKVTKIYYVAYRFHIPSQDAVSKSAMIHVSPQETYSETFDIFMDVWPFFGKRFNIVSETFLEDKFRKPIKSVEAMATVTVIE